MIRVAGRHFIERQLDWLARQDVRRVVLCIGHLGNQVRDFVGDGSQFGVDVIYVDEGEVLRGTAGSLRLAYDQNQLSPWFLVLYGDSYLDVSIPLVAKAFQAAGLPALMTVFKNDGVWEKSNAVFDGLLVTRYDKDRRDPTARMTYVDYGLLAITRQTIADRIAPDAAVDLSNLLRALSAEGQLSGFEAHQRFYEIGSPEGLSDLEGFLSSRRADDA